MSEDVLRSRIRALAREIRQLKWELDMVKLEQELDNNNYWRLREKAQKMQLALQFGFRDYFKEVKSLHGN
jgi:hypothetical protein